MVIMKNTTSKLLIILAILAIACNQQKSDVAQSPTMVNSDTTKYKPPIVIKVNRDSILKYTPGKNGIPLPTVVKASKPDIKPYIYSSIVPGISWLPQTNEERIMGKKKIMSKKPKKVKVVKDSLRLFTPGEGSVKLPKIYTIEELNSPNLIDSSYTVQHGDTIYPPVSKIYPQPEVISSFSLRQSTKNLNIKYLDVDEGMQSSFIRSICEDKRGNENSRCKCDIITKVI